VRFLFAPKVRVSTSLSPIGAALSGRFFDQTLTYEEHAAQWATAAWKLRLYTFLELNDVFGSWWFGLIIGVRAPGQGSTERQGERRHPCHEPYRR